MKNRPWTIVTGVIFMIMISVSIQATTGALSRTIMKVSKLTCGSCLILIDSKLKAYPEVDGMGASLREGIVAVDHKPSLKPEKIASIITELGYPAEVVKKITIDAKDAFSTRKQANAASCCSTGGRNDVNSTNDNSTGTENVSGSCGVGGCGIGPGSGRSCGAGSSAWKQLFQKPPEEKKTEKKPEKKPAE